MKKFTFFWLDGTAEVIEGESALQAIQSAGYGQGALAALYFHAEGENLPYRWNAKDHTWDNIPDEAQP